MIKDNWNKILSRLGRTKIGFMVKLKQLTSLQIISM